jgi:hypothetical protein
VIERATAELTELAVTVRPDWDRDALSAALSTATVSGLPWPRLLAETVRLMMREGSSPRELLDLAADVRRAYVHDPEAYKSGLAKAREAIGRPS